MTRLALCLLLLATGASADPIVLERFIPSGLSRYDDVERGVTCWITGMGSGISCLPMQNRQAGNEHQLSPHEQEDNVPTPARAQGRWIYERYQL